MTLWLVPHAHVINSNGAIRFERFRLMRLLFEGSHICSRSTLPLPDRWRGERIGTALVDKERGGNAAFYKGLY